MIRQRMACRLGAAAAAILVAAGTAAQAQSPAEFYKGRQLNLIVSHPAGGGVDIYARFYARHLGRLLVGNPTIVVQNMPGVGGVTMANYMSTHAAKDGTVVGFGAGWLATAALMGITGARYDASKFEWIGSVNAEVAVVAAWHNQPVKTADDLLKTELTVAAGGVSAMTATAPISLNRLLGMKLKVITGYAGTADQALAMERGEVGGVGGYNYTTIKSSRPDWLNDKKVNILLQYTFEPHPDLPEVPTLAKFVRNDDERAVFEIMVAPQEMGRPVFAPPGIPADRLQAQRDAFDAFIKDPAVIADAAKTKLDLFRPMHGVDVAAMVGRLTKMSPELYKKAANAMLPADVAKGAKN